MTKKTTTKPPTAPPERTDDHETDTLAVRFVTSHLSGDFEDRGVVGRDYGIDLMLEIFKSGVPTGSLVLLQIKGHAASFPRPVTYQIPVKTLRYAQMFGTAFFLVTVSLADKEARYVWLQKYIKTQLEIDSPEWRTQGKVNVTFPDDNILDAEGMERIRMLAQHFARRDLGLQFLNHAAWLRRHIRDFDEAPGHIDSAIERLKKIGELPPEFLETYTVIVEDLDVDRLRHLCEKVGQYREHGWEALDEGEREELDFQMDQLAMVQMLFLSGDEFDEFFVESTGETSVY